MHMHGASERAATHTCIPEMHDSTPPELAGAGTLLEQGRCALHGRAMELLLRHAPGACGPPLANG